MSLSWLAVTLTLSREMTATTRQISERNLNERLALSGPRDELKDLADTIDGLLARLEAHVAEQQRFAANASHELRTPLAVMRAELDVTFDDPDVTAEDRRTGVDVIRRAIARSEALIEALMVSAFEAIAAAPRLRLAA